MIGVGIRPGGHRKVLGSCGHVIAECRCVDVNKRVVSVKVLCPACEGSKVPGPTKENREP